MGTGRVMSHTRMQALFRPLAMSRSGADADGPLEGLGDGRFGIGQRRDVANGQRADDAIRGELHLQSGPAIVKRDFE